MKVHLPRLAKGLSKMKRKLYSLEQIAKKLRDSDTMLAAGKNVSEGLHHSKRATRS